MSRQRVLVIGLDGFELTFADALSAVGGLPAFVALRERSSRFLLDHGDAKRTGLAWEHISSGLSPARARRFAAVSFDPLNYSVRQEGTWFRPFVSELSARTVVFDPPYFELSRAEQVRGIVGWGAHDPGVAPQSRPARLWPELSAHFGPYPAEEWIYGSTWSCPDRTRTMADCLVRAVDTRAAAAKWMLSERLPDWDLAIVVVSELHSAIEALWHGVDPNHPLHRMPSAVAAEQGLTAVYNAVDRLIGAIVTQFADATIVIFAPHGMGPNDSDIPAMLLLPELLYRKAFGRPLLREPESWLRAENGLPLLAPRQSWNKTVNHALGERSSLPKLTRQLTRGLLRYWPASRGTTATLSGDGPSYRIPVDWMPAAKYCRYWRDMTAFALPSFYDGRVRLNLVGREKHGKVPLKRYSIVCEEVEALIRTCRDPRTGEPVARRVQSYAGSDPVGLGPTESDLVVDWQSSPLGFSHPVIGQIGPVPYRRTGGHTGEHGFAFIAGRKIPRGDHGIRSTFDVVPTIIDLLAEPIPPILSGMSLLSKAATTAEICTHRFA